MSSTCSRLTNTRGSVNSVGCWLVFGPRLLLSLGCLLADHPLHTPLFVHFWDPLVRGSLLRMSRCPLDWRLCVVDALLRCSLPRTYSRLVSTGGSVNWSLLRRGVRSERARGSEVVCPFPGSYYWLSATDESVN